MTKKFTVCFDTDSTLFNGYFDETATPRHEVIALLLVLQTLGAEIFVWSGGGIEHAQKAKERLGLNVGVIPKGSIKPDLTIDDEDVELGLANFRVFG